MIQAGNASIIHHLPRVDELGCATRLLSAVNQTPLSCPPAHTAHVMLHICKHEVWLHIQR